MNEILQNLSKKLPPRTQLLRRLIQLISFVLMPGLILSTFSAVRLVFTALLGGTFDAGILAPQLILLAIVMLTTALWGRFFCGYLCSFGTLGDVLWALRCRISKKPFRMDKRIDFAGKMIKYVILFLLVAFVWSGVFALDPMTSPWNVFGIYTSLSGWSNLSSWLSIGGALLLLIMVGSLFIERFFCRYLCPLGAIFALISKGRLFHIKKPKVNCGSCKLCTVKCCMGIDLDAGDMVTSGECIDCMECACVCPRHNVTTTAKPAIAGTATAAAMLACCYGGNAVGQAISTQSQINAAATLAADGKTYKDGSYEGVGQGYHGEIRVRVTVEGGKIANIELLSQNEDAEFFDNAWKVLSQSILTAQTTDLDAVSGATFSSNGILEAVANALGDNFDNPNDEQPQRVPQHEQGQTGTAGEVDLAQIADGTYTGTGQGYRGEIAVSVTVKGGKITDISLVSSNDDAQFFDNAWDGIIEKLLQSQSLAVDAVSGATFSSNGILEAVATALGTSFENPNDSLPRHGHGGEGGGKGQHGAATPPSIPAVDTNSLADGTYSGSGQGYRGAISVNVTVAGGKITNIALLGSNDDAEFFNNAWGSIPSRIQSAQSANVDAVSGATFSSYGIMQAVANALGTAAPSAPAASAQPAQTPAEVPAQPAQTPSATAPQIGSTDLGQIADGTYSGSGQGYRGTISVNVTVQGGRITDISQVSASDDAQFFNSAWSGVVSNILSAQTPAVDAVSGATFSSNGIMEAVANALGTTYENPNDSLPRHGHGDKGARGEFPAEGAPDGMYPPDENSLPDGMARPEGGKRGGKGKH